MIDNDGTIFDFSGEDSDWLEIYNPNKVSINLFDYSLSDKVSDPIKWTFPEVIIPPKGFLIVFCSGKDTVVNGEIHTNFSLSENEVVSLYDNNPIVINRKRLDRLEIPDLVENQSFGHLPDGGNYLGKLSKSSPGLTNNFSDEIYCSVESGFYTEDKKVHLSSAMGFEIRYTLDGSEPTEESELYSKPIELSNSNLKENKYCNIVSTPPQDVMEKLYHHTPQVNIRKIHTLKFASFIGKQSLGKIYSRAIYIDSLNPYKDIPVISLTLDSLDMFGFNEGIYVPGKFFNEQDQTWSGNYFTLSENEEKKANLIYFENDFNYIFNQDITLNISGKGTRIYSQKSFKLNARNFNNSDEFEFKLNNSVNTKYKHVKLKSTFGVWSKLNTWQNELASELVKELNFERLNYRPCVVFINGEYWGVYTLTEVKNKEYFAQFHNSHEDSIDAVMNHINYPQINSGDNYYKLIEFIENNSLEKDENYNYIKDHIDVNSIVDYFAFQMIIANYDWPHNNILAWKARAKNSKWRWVLYDVDAAFILRNDMNVFDHITQEIHDDWPNSKGSTFLIRNLLKNRDFRNYFVERFNHILDNHFNYDLVKSKYKELKDYYTQYLDEHYLRFNYPIDYGNWLLDFGDDIFDEFITEWPKKLSQQLDEYLKTTSVEISQDDFNVYPNPSNGFINIESEDVNYNSNIKIYNTFGELVYQRANLNFSKFNIDLSYLPNGAYFIQIENNNNQLITKKINIIK